MSNKALIDKVLSDLRAGEHVQIYALPGLERLSLLAEACLACTSLENNLPQVIVICFGSRDPAQTADSLLATARKVVHKEAIRVALVAEGNKLAADQKKLRRLCHVVVGTLDRICGLLENGDLVSPSIRLLALDGAASLQDQSVKSNISWLQSLLPPTTQILACSEGPLLSQAQDKLLSIAKDWRLTSFLPCLLGGPQHAHFYEIEEGGDVSGHNLLKRVSMLLTCLQTRKYTQCLVFCSSTEAADTITKHLSTAQLKPVKFTGESVYIGQLKISTEVFNYKCRVAVIADVNSSEFLQFDRADLFIHFDPPQSMAEYSCRASKSRKCPETGTSLYLTSPARLKELKEVIWQASGQILTPNTELDASVLEDGKPAFTSKALSGAADPGQPLKGARDSSNATQTQQFSHPAEKSELPSPLTGATSGMSHQDNGQQAGIPLSSGGPRWQAGTIPNIERVRNYSPLDASDLPVSQPEKLGSSGLLNAREEPLDAFAPTDKLSALPEPPSVVTRIFDPTAACGVVAVPLPPSLEADDAFMEGLAGDDASPNVDSDFRDSEVQAEEPSAKLALMPRPETAEQQADTKNTGSKRSSCLEERDEMMHEATHKQASGNIHANDEGIVPVPSLNESLEDLEAMLQRFPSQPVKVRPKALPAASLLDWEDDGNAMDMNDGEIEAAILAKHQDRLVETSAEPNSLNQELTGIDAEMELQQDTSMIEGISDQAPEQMGEVVDPAEAQAAYSSYTPAEQAALWEAYYYSQCQSPGVAKEPVSGGNPGASASGDIEGTEQGSESVQGHASVWAQDPGKPERTPTSETVRYVSSEALPGRQNPRTPEYWHPGEFTVDEDGCVKVPFGLLKRYYELELHFCTQHSQTQPQS